MLLRAPILVALCAGVWALDASTFAQSADPQTTVYEVALPGTLRGALAAIGDTVPPDRSQFLLEFIRRSHNLQFLGKVDMRTGPVRSLVSYLDSAATLASSENSLPLPLSPDIWTEVVFGGHATAGTLLRAIVQSREASLLYFGLLSLDEETRLWIGGHRSLIGELLPHAAAFAAAAPGLRISGSDLRLPGDEAGKATWESLIGHSAKDADGFIRSLIVQRDGRMAYFFGAMGQLTPPQIRFALELGSPDAGVRIDAARRLYGIFDRLSPGWKVVDRAFQRPALDPALLATDLRVDAAGAPVLPGTRRFWSAVFAENAGRLRERDEDVRAIADDRQVDLAWLCEQIFGVEPGEQRRRYYSVLYASRALDSVTTANARDAVDAVRAVIHYPALAVSLERAQVVDIGIVAAAARRAAQITAMADDAKMERALAQFQAMVSMVSRAAGRGSLSPDTASSWMSSLCAIEPNERDGYGGSLMVWLDERLRDLGPRHTGQSDDSLDQNLLRLIAGPAAGSAIVDWEGTRYRVDLAKAEAIRIEALLGESAAPYLSSARTLSEIADGLAANDLTVDRLREYSSRFDLATRVTGLGVAEEWADADVPGRCRDATTTIERAARGGDVQAAARVSPALRLLADDLAVRGLTALTYAVAMGQRDRTPISAVEAARRHDFGVRTVIGRRLAPWLTPVAGSGLRGWRVQGSLLNLDVALAEFSLLPLSSKPPTQRPTLNDEDRRLMTEATAAFRSGMLDDQDRDRIVDAVRKGRARVTAIKSPADALSIADEIGLSPMRRTLLPWIVRHDAGRLMPFFSPSELFQLGAGQTAFDTRLDGWGILAQPRLGCLCQQLLPRRAWEAFAGRWSSGIMMSGFPDLNIRLAELLAELHMPATLLGPVLWSASLDFINNVPARDQDDHRALVEFVQALRADRLEQYLALLTTDGPLVPINEGSGDAVTGRAGR